MDEKELSQTWTASTEQHYLDMEQLKRVLKQYQDSHQDYLKQRLEQEANRYIKAYEMGLISRGMLAQQLVHLGYPELEVVEILESKKL